jgi:hypothetical protein
VRPDAAHHVLEAGMEAGNMLTGAQYFFSASNGKPCHFDMHGGTFNMNMSSEMGQGPPAHIDALVVAPARLLQVSCSCLERLTKSN